MILIVVAFAVASDKFSLDNGIVDFWCRLVLRTSIYSAAASPNPGLQTESAKFDIWESIDIIKDNNFRSMYEFYSMKGGSVWIDRGAF